MFYLFIYLFLQGLSVLFIYLFIFARSVCFIYFSKVCACFFGLVLSIAQPLCTWSVKCNTLNTSCCIVFKVYIINSNRKPECNQKMPSLLSTRRLVCTVSMYNYMCNIWNTDIGCRLKYTVGRILIARFFLLRIASFSITLNQKNRRKKNMQLIIYCPLGIPQSLKLKLALYSAIRNCLIYAIKPRPTVVRHFQCVYGDLWISDLILLMSITPFPIQVYMKLEFVVKTFILFICEKY